MFYDIPTNLSGIFSHAVTFSLCVHAFQDSHEFSQAPVSTAPEHRSRISCWLLVAFKYALRTVSWFGFVASLFNFLFIDLVLPLLTMAFVFMFCLRHLTRLWPMYFVSSTMISPNLLIPLSGCFSTLFLLHKGSLSLPLISVNLLCLDSSCSEQTPDKISRPSTIIQESLTA